LGDSTEADWSTKNKEKKRKGTEVVAGVGSLEKQTMQSGKEGGLVDGGTNKNGRMAIEWVNL